MAKTVRVYVPSEALLELVEYYAIEQELITEYEFATSVELSFIDISEDDVSLIYEVHVDDVEVQTITEFPSNAA